MQSKILIVGTNRCLPFRPGVIISIAWIPAVITSTMCGDALGIEQYTVAIWVFGLTAVISLMGLLFYKKISRIAGEKNAE